jgi:hypothetical protein
MTEEINKRVLAGEFAHRMTNDELDHVLLHHPEYKSTDIVEGYLVTNTLDITGFGKVTTYFINTAKTAYLRRTVDTEQYHSEIEYNIYGGLIKITRYEDSLKKYITMFFGKNNIMYCHAIS